MTSKFVTRHRTTIKANESPAKMANMPFPVFQPNQNYMLCSVIGPNTVPSCKSWAIRVYGTFATAGEADKCADEALEKGYTLFNLETVVINQGFIPMPPPGDEDIPAVRYAKEQACLHKLMTGHRELLTSGSNRVESRADAELDDRSTVDVFDNMVTRGAKQMFEEWKETGVVPDAAAITEKNKLTFEKNINALIEELHSDSDEEDDDKKAPAEKKEKKETKGIGVQKCEDIEAMLANDPNAIVARPMRLVV